MLKMIGAHQHPATLTLIMCALAATAPSCSGFTICQIGGIIVVRSALTRRSQKISFRRKRGPGVYPEGGHRKMSKADHDQPLQWHWLYIPLVAFLVFAVGPSVLAPIFFVLSLFVDVSSIVGPVQRAPDLFSILISPFFLGLTFWPFLWLYGFARDALIEDPSSENSVRLATIMSVIAMSVPCSLFLVATPGEMMSSAPDAGQGTGIASFLFIIFLPLPGILGWLTGRGIAWILWP